ncbi:MAG: hypothetical protein KC431_12370 [Myxococcales bacterium]|nr:hypothetical protein [Myxococcales bacterium]
MSRKTHAPLFLLAALTLSAVTATACALDEGDDAQELRAVKITDKWGVLDPTHFPEVNSCEDYWIQRCANLSADQCTLAQSRYSCSQSNSGVVITDTFGDVAESVAWEGYARGDDSAVMSGGGAAEACETMSLDPERCQALAALAEVLGEASHEIMDKAPAGGFASVIVIEDNLMVIPDLPSGEDLVWEAADALDWEMPMLTAEFAFANPGLVIEDNVMLLVRPNGTISVSSSDAVFLQDNHWEDCVECDDTIDMYIEEYILIDG